MMLQQRLDELDRKLTRLSTAQRLEIAGWAVVAAFFLTSVLYVIPYYNRLYRISVHLFSNILFFLNPVIMAFVLIPIYFHKKQPWRILLCIVIGLLLTLATTQTYTWRVQITDAILKAFYCQDNKPVGRNPVLGGIRSDGRLFANDSHCLIVVCDEEIYSCSEEPVILASTDRAGSVLARRFD